jgi:aryl-alcohol dehydrogenase-like predicted oxidoreductase
MVEDQWISHRRGWGRFVGTKSPYSLPDRGIEREVLPVAQRYQLGGLTWSRLAGGWRSGAIRKGASAPATRRAQMMPAWFDPSLTTN